MKDKATDIAAPLFYSSPFAYGQALLDGKTFVPQAWILMDEVVGHVMTRLRTEKGVAQEDMAATLDIHPTALSKMEAGSHAFGFTIPMIALVAQTLEISTADILKEIHFLVEDLRKDGILAVYSDRDAVGSKYTIPK